MDKDPEGLEIFLERSIMRVKKEYVVLVVIIVALSAYLLLRNRDKTHYQLPRLAHVNQKKISKIEISKADNSIVLKKQDDKWHILPKGYLASDDSVSNMLDTIEDMTLTALVSKSKSYERYDLGDDKKITVKAWAGDKLKREFDLGKAAPSFRHTFVRLAHDDRVYHARGNFRARFDQTVDKLRDKTVLSFKKEDIQEIRLAKGKQAVTLSRLEAPVEVNPKEKSQAKKASPTQQQKTVWRTPDGQQADETKLNRLLATLSNLRCDKYLDDISKESLPKPVYTIRLKGVDELTLSILDKQDKKAEDYPAISSSNEYPFLLRKWHADNIMTNLDALLKTTQANKAKPEQKKIP